jgi:DNA-binding protein HU-beta
LQPKSKIINNNKEKYIMTKAEIVNSISQRTGIGKLEVSATVEALMDEIRNSLAVNKENVYLRGFGSFIVKHRAQKTARNISKNTTLVIEAHDLPAFKPCKSFIEKMSEGK